MPYCTQCGNSIGDRDQYCGSCGSAQPNAPRTSRPPSASQAASQQSGAKSSGLNVGDLSAHTASILCYIPVIGWVPCLVVLATEKFRDDHATRFHAFQGLYLFIAWLLVDWVLSPMFRFSDSTHAVGGMLKAVLFVAWIWMLVKVSQHQSYKLPVLGDLAEKSVAEQR
ncbi:MAG: DUF4870 domain-containing protein [Acidobacteria bacterium]|nr:DUF4870 domain-containing protein [Acidobacteriota bacterium]